MRKGASPARAAPFPTHSQATTIMQPAPAAPLLNVEAAGEFLAILGADPAAVHFRGIHWNKALEPPEARARHLSPAFGSRAPQLESLQQQGYRLYWLPNGGPYDRDVLQCCYLFVEWDEQPIEWQLQAWQELGLPEPTAMVNTGGKSIHCYWRLSAPITPDRWRALIQRLIRYCGSDPTCKNPSRLMRLAGSAYIRKTDDLAPDGTSLGGTIGPAPAAVVRANAAAVYPAELFEDRLPALPEPPAPPQPLPSPSASTAGTGTVERRSIEEITRLVAAYPTILSNNDQREEALRFIAGLVRVMEDLGQSRAAAIALASTYHPQAADTFQQVEKWRFGAFGVESFIAQCKRAGVDVRRRDLPERNDLPRPEEPDLSSFAPPHPELWSDEDRRIAGDAAAAIVAAGSRSLTLDQVLPQGMAGPLVERAAAFPCDPMAFLLPLLCTTASVIGNRMEVRVKATWREPFVLWAANVMPASSLKSPIASVILKPLSKWQVELNKVKKREKAEYNSSRNQIALQGDKERLAEWEAENPPPSPARELFIIDVTLEKIGQMLGQPETCGMVAYHDELTLWFQQLRRGKDALDQRSNWLSLWTGGLLKVDRIGRDSIYIPNTAQSVFGLSTVDGLRIIQSSGQQSDGNQDADGLWARFLLWQPRDVPYVFNDLDRDITDLLLNTFRDRIDALVPSLKDDHPPAALSLTAEGIAMMAQHWTAWDALARETAKERGQWLGKLRGHSVRIAGLLHVLDCAAKDLPIIAEVSTDAARRSLLLCHALLDQYDFLHASIGSDADGLDPAVAKLLARGVEWRRTHGDEPVPMEQLRRWKLPTRDASAADRQAWLATNVAANDRLGRIQTTARSITWLPPVN